MTDCALRAQSRRLFPFWSRRMRAKWVIAKRSCISPRVAISSMTDFNHAHYFFKRTL